MQKNEANRERKRDGKTKERSDKTKEAIRLAKGRRNKYLGKLVEKEGILGQEVLRKLTGSELNELMINSGAELEKRREE